MTRRITNEERAILDAVPAARGGHSLEITPDDVIGIVTSELRDVLGNALIDLADANRAIQQGIDLALSTGDVGVLAELEAQLKGLAEINEIKATKAALRAGLSVARGAVRVAIGAMS